MKINIKKFDKFILGFIPGLILPAAFIWLYIHRLYPSDKSVLEVLKDLYPSVILGKLLLLSVLPDLLVVFLLYKSDTFRIAVGCIAGAVVYIIAAAFML